MFDVIKRSVNTNLNKPLDTLITEKSTETNGKIDSKASQTSVTSMDTKVGVTSDAAGTASAGTLFSKMNKLLTDWTTARAAKIDTIATDVTSLKTSVVNGKQAVVNAINGSVGYASGLTTSNTHDDYAWWIQNMVTSASQGSIYSSLYSKAAGIAGNTIAFTTTPRAKYTNSGTYSYTFDSIGLYSFSDANSNTAIRTTVLSGAADIRKVGSSQYDIIYVTSAPCSVNVNVLTPYAYLYKL